VAWRKIDSRVWSDGWFLGLSDDARMLWLYLLTCQHWAGSLPGLFRCHSGTAAGDLGWEQSRYDAAFNLILSSKRIEFDRRTGLLWIVKAHEYCSEKMTTREMYWPGIVESLPECPLREKAWEKILAGYAVRKSEKLARSDPRSEIPSPISHLPSPISVIAGAGRLRGNSKEAARSVHGKKKEAEKREMTPKAAAGVNSWHDLAPYVQDLLEAQRAAWGYTETPPPPTGDAKTRWLQAYHQGEQEKAGRGVQRMILAIRGHAIRQKREKHDPKLDPLQFAFPPLLEDSECKWDTLDPGRFHELVELGSKSEPSGSLLVAKKRRSGDPPPGRKCRECARHLECASDPVEFSSKDWNPDGDVCTKPGKGAWKERPPEHDEPPDEYEPEEEAVAADGVAHREEEW
jgi:hypothetical protein